MKNIEKCTMNIHGERCVICGQETGMKKDWPIAMRKYYVEGAGQLCKKCYSEIYSEGN